MGQVSRGKSLGERLTGSLSTLVSCSPLAFGTVTLVCVVGVVVVVGGWGGGDSSGMVLVLDRYVWWGAGGGGGGLIRNGSCVRQEDLVIYVKTC